MRRLVVAARRPLAIATIVGTLTALASTQVAAGPVEECVFDAGTATVTIEVQDDVVIVTDANDPNGSIVVDGSPCGVATVTNTDLVDIHAGSDNRIDIVTDYGAFAPGATEEGDGASEIEFHITQGTDAVLAISGGAASDAFATALAHIAPSTWVDAINLNADESVLDHDVLSEFGLMSGLFVTGGGGSDRFDLTGGGAGEAPMPVATTVGGGPGDDRFSFRGGFSDLVAIFGGGGTDALDLSSAQVAANVIVNLRRGDGIVNGSFSVADLEELVGHDGVDIFVGDSRRQRFAGGQGDDSLLGRAGGDHLVGGIGDDRVYGGLGHDTCRPGTGNDTVRSCEA